MQIIKGSLKAIELDSGIDASVSDLYPVIPEEELRRVAEDIKNHLAFFFSVN